MIAALHDPPGAVSPLSTPTPPSPPFTTGLTPWAQTLPQHISPTAAKSYLFKETKTPQVIRVQSPPADAHRKRRVTALLETAVEGIASNRYHPQPAMHCSWCQFKNECMAWLPGALPTASTERMRAA